MECNHLPEAVEGRGAGGPGGCVGHVPNEIAQVLKQFVVADADLLHLSAGVLDDGQVFARVALARLAVQRKPTPIGQVPPALDRSWRDRNDRVIELVVDVEELAWLEGETNG